MRKARGALSSSLKQERYFSINAVIKTVIKSFCLTANSDHKDENDISSTRGRDSSRFKRLGRALRSDEVACKVFPRDAGQFL